MMFFDGQTDPLMSSLAELRDASEAWVDRADAKAPLPDDAPSFIRTCARLPFLESVMAARDEAGRMRLSEALFGTDGGLAGHIMRDRIIFFSGIGLLSRIFGEERLEAVCRALERLPENRNRYGFGEKPLSRAQSYGLVPPPGQMGR